jgi:hypothetical protein
MATQLCDVTQDPGAEHVLWFAREEGPSGTCFPPHLDRNSLKVKYSMLFSLQDVLALYTAMMLAANLQAPARSNWHVFWHWVQLAANCSSLLPLGPSRVGLLDG